PPRHRGGPGGGLLRPHPPLCPAVAVPGPPVGGEKGGLPPGRLPPRPAVFPGKGDGRMAAILITGANQGIGYHLTAALLRQGHQVAVLDWETHHLAALQNTFPTQLAYYPVDVRQ